MDYLVFIVLTASLLVYSLFARVFSKLLITGPILMIVVGALANLVSLNPISVPSFEVIKQFAELTLAIILFSDAAHAKLRVLKHHYATPLLLLLVALPLSFAAGTLFAYFLFPELGLMLAALIAIILTPTDAALGRTVLISRYVSSDVKEAINVESGLNDGLCVPIFIALLWLVTNTAELSTLGAATLFAREIGIALLVALVTLPVLMWLIEKAQAQKLMSAQVSSFSLVFVAVLVFAIAQYVGGSGFFAAFVAGLLFDWRYKHDTKHLWLKDIEEMGDTLSLIVWFMVGLSCSYLFKLGFSWQVLVYSLLSLTIVRMIPVFLSLFFSDQAIREKGLLAWFGPRGLASVVFVMIALEHNVPNAELVFQVVLTTILVSVLLHGITSLWVIAEEKKRLTTKCD